MESGAPTSGEMPATFLDTATTPLACPLPLTDCGTRLEPANGLNSSDAKDANYCPRLFADDARPKPEQEPPREERQEIERPAISAEVPVSGETSSDTASEARISNAGVPDSNDEQNQRTEESDCHRNRRVRLACGCVGRRLAREARRLDSPERSIPRSVRSIKTTLAARRSTAIAITGFPCVQRRYDNGRHCVDEHGKFRS